MKSKILYIAVALACSCGVLTSCDEDFAYPPVVTPDTSANKGVGSPEDPFNVSAAVYQASINGQSSEDYYYTGGYVISGSIDATYGNAEFVIADAPDATEPTIIVYRAKYFNDTKFPSTDLVKVGDYIVVYAPIVNFKGNTPETNGGYLYQINDNVGSNKQPWGPIAPSEPKGDGTVNNPFNATAAIAKAQANGSSSDVPYFTGGYVASAAIDTNYGNADLVISDNADGSGSRLTVYRVKDINNAKFTDANKVKIGDYVVVYAPLINYNNSKPETNGGYLYQINDTKSTILDDNPVTPPAGDAKEYTLAKEIAEGTDYIMIAEGNLIQNLAESYNYGYLKIEEAPAVANDKCTSATANIWHFKKVDGGYNITDGFGRYLYLSGTYNSFNVAADAPDQGAVWKIEFNDKGEAVITNVAMNKSIQFDSQYGSCGAYPEVKGTFPKLYMHKAK